MRMHALAGCNLHAGNWARTCRYLARAKQQARHLPVDRRPVMRCKCRQIDIGQFADLQETSRRHFAVAPLELATTTLPPSPARRCHLYRRQ